MLAKSLSRQQTLGITHFLCIPLATSTSRPMISDAYRKIIHDPASSNIPKLYFKYPEQLHVNLGNLRLDTPQRLDRALTLLRSLDIPSILHDTFYSSASYTRSTTKTISSLNSILDVSLEGIYCDPRHQGNSKELFALYANVFGRSGLLPRVCVAIYKALSDADLVSQDPGPGLLSRNLLPSIFIGVVESKRVSTKVDRDNPYLLQMGIRKKRTAWFDATDLLNEYHDMTWAKQFRLEKLSIRKLGLQDIVRDGNLISRGYIETGSVSLPGAPTGQPEPWIEGGRYVKHRPVVPSPLYKPVTRDPN